MPLHVSRTCAHHQEVKIAFHSPWYHRTCRWPSRAQVERGLSCKPIFVLHIKRHTYFIEVRFPFLYSVEMFVLKTVKFEILTEVTKITCVVRDMITCILVET